MDAMISPATLCREAEMLHWLACGSQGDLTGGWSAGYRITHDDIKIGYLPDKEWLCIPGRALVMSLANISEQYLEPFVRDLPSVKASAYASAEAARAAASAEYDSWSASDAR